MTFRSFATISTMGTALLLSVTGISMLFGHNTGNISPIHELAGVLFLIGVSMHIYVNRKSIFKHLSSLSGKLIVGGFLIAAVLVVVLN